jgi:hypothetical protein
VAVGLSFLTGFGEVQLMAYAVLDISEVVKKGSSIWVDGGIRWKKER